MKKIGVWLFRIVTAILSVAVLSVILLILNAGLPMIFGPYKEFYRSCKAIKPGTTLAEARRRMSPYLEIGRNYIPEASQAQFYRATIMGAKESKSEHDKRIVFIPDRNGSADWCVIYPDGETVRRIEISPD